MLSGAAFRNLLDSMQSSYDYILLDSPPVLVVTDALILSQYCDGVILVLRIGQTERRNFGDALRALGGIHANILGVVCNGVDLSRRGSYGYGYSYEGYRQYGSDNDAATPRAVAVGGKPNA
jgi:Mrp family chromosome partitioning ATPase